MTKIKFLRNREIDRKKWDSCIANGKPVFAYAFSTYLDGVCDGKWHALVFNDYEAVFPLPFKARYGITYLCQPLFCQQLGAFGSDQNVDTISFINAIPWFFIRVRLHFNTRFTWNHATAASQKPLFQFHPNTLKNEKLTEKINLLTPLIQPVEYTKETKRNLERAKKNEIQVLEHVTETDKVIELFRSAWGHLNLQVRNDAFDRFRKAIRSTKGINTGFNNVVYSAHSTAGELLGAAIFLKTIGNKHGPGFLHYVCAAPTQNGKDLCAMHAIIHHVINQHTGQSFCFDFEGSTIPSVAAFYRKFGAQESNYLYFSRGI